MKKKIISIVGATALLFALSLGFFNQEAKAAEGEGTVFCTSGSGGNCVPSSNNPAFTCEVPGTDCSGTYIKEI